jgi:hypothetical protein
MKKYYTIESNPFINNNCRIRLGAIPDSIDRRAYLLDEWQYLNDEEEFIPFERMGNDLPDIYTLNIPLISKRLKETLDDAEVSNTFYKPIYLYEVANRSKIEEYYLMLAEALDCVDWDKSEHTEDSFSGLKKITGPFAINTSIVGDFRIFKIQGVLNRFWIIDQELKDMFESLGIKGAKILPLEEYYGI